MRIYGLGSPLSIVALLALWGCGGGSAQALVDVSPADEQDCPAGGVVISTGIDEDGNGRLDPDEVTHTEVVCNGEPAPVDSDSDSETEIETDTDTDTDTCAGRPQVAITGVELTVPPVAVLDDPYPLHVTVEGDEVELFVSGGHLRASAFTETDAEGTYRADVRFTSPGGPQVFAVIAQDGCSLAASPVEVPSVQRRLVLDVGPHDVCYVGGPRDRLTCVPWHESLSVTRDMPPLDVLYGTRHLSVGGGTIIGASRAPCSTPARRVAGGRARTRAFYRG
ncbi:MAG: hypothetical protein EA397_18055 [Deltaproteobacteria bacterium]|nr:MAG: hypothetical protein EA397_18055 [Deltaproteobacteria bacterium]